MKKILSIDIETKSSIDIKKAGLYKYAQSDDFSILLFSYRYDDEDVKIIDFTASEVLPQQVVDDLKNSNVIKRAYSAAFEWYCLNISGYESPLEQWQCTMIHGMYLSYPAGLSEIGKALGLDEDKQKLKSGTALINYFSKPCKPTKINGGRLWNLPHHDEDKWRLYKEYNVQDVITECAVADRLKAFTVPENIWDEWRDDVMMNADGIMVDKRLVDCAITVDDISTTKLLERSKEITGLSNPKSQSQFLAWLNDKLDNPVENIQKTTVSELLNKELPQDVREALEIRQKLGKTSVSKYKAMDSAICSDDRIRGLLQFYGASRTGRWAGRLVQVQNLPRNYIDVDSARRLLKDLNYEAIHMIYGNTADTLSQLIRTAFVAPEGKKFIVSDFSAIEARVVAWISGEKWVNEVFRTHGKIYEATASQMFHVPVEKIKKGNPEYDLRQKGKVATLALGYQGGVNALISMGALNMGLKEDELPDIVSRWRNANANIVGFWNRVGALAIDTVETGRVNEAYGLTFRYENDFIYGLSFLTVELPSSRKLYYAEPKVDLNQFERPAIFYKAMNQTTRKWTSESTYGGKLTENIVQAVARDCLSEALNNVRKEGYKVVMHIHDEIVIEANDNDNLEDVNKILARPIKWAPGLVLKGDGFEGKYYRKD